MRSKVCKLIIHLLRLMIMKNFAKLTALLTFATIGVLFLTVSCQKANDESALTADLKSSTTTTVDPVNCNCVIDPLPTVNETETAMLIFMREEEKLARDVYQVMSGLYSQPIFKNIAKSEQKHMDQVLCLLQYYNIPDPASAEVGVFTNTDLQALYDALIAQGSVSLVEALKVGATIEDKDIFDLTEEMMLTANPAIINVFTNLACASGNHMRSFSALLLKKGVTYVPQFISQEEYDAIIGTPAQSCGGL